MDGGDGEAGVEERKGKDSNSDDLGRTWWKLPTVLDTEKTSVISSLF